MKSRIRIIKDEEDGDTVFEVIGSDPMNQTNACTFDQAIELANEWGSLMGDVKKGTIYAYCDTVPEPIPADRWMWQTGDSWMAVSPGESEADWFQDLDERGVECPTPRVRPIDDIPTSGTLIYMRHDFTEVERPADGQKEEEV